MASGSRFRWRLLSSMSLRSRIALYYTGATAVLIAIVFAGIAFTVDNVVYRHLDEVLQKESFEILGKSHVRDGRRFDDFVRGAGRRDDDDDDRKGKDDDDFRKAYRHDRFGRHHKDLDAEFVQFVDARGSIVWKSASLFDNALAFDIRVHELAFRNGTVGSSAVRQLQMPLTGSDGRPSGLLIVAVPLKGAILVLRDMERIMLFSFPLIIFLLFVVSRLIAGQSIRPIDEVIASAESITQSNLGQRIPLPQNHDEIYRMSVTVNALLDRLQQAFQREKQFTADASHELKTPLAVVKGTLEVLIRKPRDTAHYVSRISDSLAELNRMAKLIDQLLMLARFSGEGARPVIVPVDLPVPLGAAIARLQPFIRAKAIALSLDDRQPGKVAADPSLLEIIFENLISNAVKYSPEGSAIDILIERRQGVASCTISDHGVGIAGDKLSAIFDRFYRVDESRSSSTGGSGLGLSIVRKLADLQSIDISVSSEVGQGTVFTLLFPLAGDV